MSAAYSRLVELRKKDSKLLQGAATQQLLQQLESMLPRVLSTCPYGELSCIARACANLQRKSAAEQLVLPMLLRRDRLLQADFSATANTLVALAGARIRVQPEQLQVLVNVFLEQLPSVSAKAVGNSLWALGKLGAHLSRQHAANPAALHTASSAVRRPARDCFQCVGCSCRTWLQASKAATAAAAGSARAEACCRRHSTPAAVGS